MNKSSLIGFILIAAILIFWMNWMKPKKDQASNTEQVSKVEQVQQNEPDTEALPENTAVLANDSSSLADQYQQNRALFGVFASASMGEEQFWTLESPLQKITISNKGGAIKEVELMQYQTYDSLPLLSFDPETSVFDLAIPMGELAGKVRDAYVHTAQLFFVPYVNGKPYDGDTHLMTSEGEVVEFAMRAYADDVNGQHNEDQYVEFVYVFHDDNYMMDFDIRVVGLKDVIAFGVEELNLDWQVDLLQHEKDVDRFITTTVYYKAMNDNEVERLNDRSKADETINGNINWVSFKERFFCNVLVAKNGFTGAKIGVNAEKVKKNPKYFKTMYSIVGIPYDYNADSNECQMSFYFGPNHFKTLKSYGLNLQRQIDVGRFFLIRWINYGVIYVFNWLGSYGWSYGIVILILTIMIKVLLFPIAFKSYKSTAVTRVLKPEIEAINAKYPKEEDAMKKQQAIMNLQKQAGASPTAGCIPMLLQFPILIAVFRFFPSSIELRQQPFLWAEDLSTYDSILDLPFNIPFYGDHVSLFCLLMTITTFIYTYVNNKQMDTTANPQMKGMKVMMYIMPIMFLGIFNSYSAGLSYYYMLANIITFLQMFVFRKMISEEKVRATIEENKKKPVKKSRFMQRLEEAQKEQQKQLRNSRK